MKTLGGGISVFAFSLLSAGLLVSESKAAGPVTVQQSVSQVETSLTDASVGCRHCGYRRGWGWGGGYALGYGYGGYYGGYGGWGYSRPVIYSYPAYSYVRYRRPVYYTGYYSYAPYQSSCNCGYAYNSYQPSVYSVSNYSYPSYSTGAVYSTSGYTAPVYTPSYTSPTVISAPTPYYAPTTTVAPTPSVAPAPYPAPPVEYTQPSAYRAPIATLPMATASSVNSSAANSSISLINVPSYSSTYGTSEVVPAAYSPVTYGYTAYSPMVNRSSGNTPW